jgi:hypothetical protein
MEHAGSAETKLSAQHSGACHLKFSRPRYDRFIQRPTMDLISLPNKYPQQGRFFRKRHD